MTRNFLSLLICLLLAASSLAEAQGATRRPVRRGDITGVELHIEGSRQVVAGETLRLSVRSFEVVGVDGLRPVAGANIFAASSFHADERVQFQTDARGFGIVEMEMPEDALGGGGLSIVVRVPGVQRRYQLPIEVVANRRLIIRAPSWTTSEASVPVFGGLFEGETPVANHEVSLQLRGPEGILDEATVQTNAEGLYSFAFPEREFARGNLQVVARAQDDEGHTQQAQATLALRAPQHDALLTYARPRTQLARPGQRVPIDIVVRRADGRPATRALVSFNGITEEPIEPVSRNGNRNQWTRTDAQGRAQLVYEVPNLQSGIRDLNLTVHAHHSPGGSGRTNTLIRVAAQERFAQLAIDAGFLHEELGGRVFLRLTGSDGLALDGQEVRLEGARLGDALRARTDEAGVAVVDIESLRSTENDPCGIAATRLQVHSGDSELGNYCVPISSAASVIPTPAELVVTDTIEVALRRRRDVRRAPVEVLALRGNEILARTISSGPSATLQIPSSESGAIRIRTRALVQGTRVQGASSFVWRGDVEPAPQLRAEAAGEESLRVQSNADFVVVSAEPLAQRSAAELYGSERRGGRLTASLRGMMMASAAPEDITASVRLDSGELVPLPEPGEAGPLLRDPWRQRARFVEGRLALLFRAVEQRVAGVELPELDSVASTIRGRRQFNRELLASLDEESLGGEGATGLGGEAITIDRLESLDSAFDFDHVAARISRQRLFALMLQLRDFVHNRGLDLIWARPGDPTLWLEVLTNEGAVMPRDVVDAWGRPFRLIATRRARFQQLQPVDGYELVSAGPDGRYGTRDDLFDPTARVLPEGSLYAEAVGEDSLVARLRGVSLSRAEAGLIAQHFGQRPLSIPRRGSRSRTSLGSLPALLAPPADLDRVERLTSPAAPIVASASGDVRIDGSPRSYRVRAMRLRGGQWSESSVFVRGGGDLLTSISLPERLYVGEGIQAPLFVTNTSDRDREVEVVARVGEREERYPLSLPAGEYRRVDVALGSGPGDRPGPLALRVEVEGRPIAEDEIALLRGMHPIRRRASALVGENAVRMSMTVPAGARDAVGRVIVMRPQGVARDPEFQGGELGIVLSAWAQIMGGQDLDSRSRVRLLREMSGGERSAAESGDILGLRDAASLAPLSTLVDARGRSDREALRLRGEALARLQGSSRGALSDENVLLRAAQVLALASSGVGESGTQMVHPLLRIAPEIAPPPASDGVSRLLREWQTALRAELLRSPGRPGLLAAASAATLCLDPRDGHGRAMLERILEAREEAEGGQAIATEEPGERIAATSAAALALSFAGREAEAAPLIAHLSRRVHDISRSSLATFWWLSLQAYRARQHVESATGTVEVEVDGERRTIELRGGIGVLALPEGRGELRFLSGESPYLARAESVFAVPYEAREQAPLRVEIVGNAQSAPARAALALQVNANADVESPIVELRLPSVALVDEPFLRRVRAESMVADVEEREPGLLRLRLRPLRAEQEISVALPIWLSAHGDVRGFAAIAYDAARPAEMSVSPGEDLRLQARE